MTHHISCTRCGHDQQAPMDISNEWDEITCSECGEFLDTVGHWNDMHSLSFAMQTLNKSRTLTLQMARESRPVNDNHIGHRATA